MKKLFVTMVCLGLAAPLLADGTNQFADEKSRISYAIGLSIGHGFKQQGVDVDLDMVGRAMKDVLTGSPELMTEAQMRETLQNFSRENRARQLAKFKAEGESFLATNKMNPGVRILSVTLPGGQSSELQYLVVSNGTGPLPTATDKVSVNYRGTLINGTEFDSSYKRGHAATFPVGGVIPGWSQALQKMPVGSKWKLFIPSELGYGERGAQPNIPPNSTLIFDVELLGIESAPPPPAPPAPLTSDIIKVPSAEELKNGAKIEVIKSEDVQKAQAQAQSTNK